MFRPNLASVPCRQAILAVVISFTATTPVWSFHRPDIAPQLASGQLADAEQLLKEYLDRQPSDDLTRFKLGTVQFLRAAERLSQDGVRYGALKPALMLPFLRVGGFAGGKREPEPVTYNDLRAMIERFQKGIAVAADTLAKVKDENLSWDLDLQQVRLDLDGDGKATDGETLGVLFTSIANHRQMPADKKEMMVGFDSADVYWLRGYCEVLSALADVILAYDEQRLFDVTAQAFFAKPKTEFASHRKEAPKEEEAFGSFGDVADVIAAIHLMNFKLHEPKRLASAQQHLLKMVEYSRMSWKLILKETDDHFEWIPGPKQHSVIEGLEINPERVAAWGRFLDEAEAVITGKKLLPFWRTGFSGGVNLGKFFTEPRDFDLVLWVQGTAALPYLEDGDKTSPDTWREFQMVFRGEFIGFAAWIN
jgi:hypothetical protein